MLCTQRPPTLSIADLQKRSTMPGMCGPALAGLNHALMTLSGHTLGVEPIEGRKPIAAPSRAKMEGYLGAQPLQPVTLPGSCKPSKPSSMKQTTA